MFRKIAIVALLACTLAVCGLAGCGTSDKSGSGSDNATASGVAALKDTRDISWEGDELTVTVGTNKSTGCEWTAKFEDDKIIGYSINRKFKLSDDGLKKGEAVGTSAIGFQGKSAGTTKIYLTTPKDWEGNEPGYEYTVTVTVGDDGTIQDATGE